MAYHTEKARHLPHPGLLGTPPRAPLGPFEPSGGSLESALGLFESALEPFEYALAPSAALARDFTPDLCRGRNLDEFQVSQGTA